jgi:hypothetical protein
MYRAVDKESTRLKNLQPKKQETQEKDTSTNQKL